jgi:hypothetical protein
VLTISLHCQADADDFCAFLRAVHVAVLNAEGTTVTASVPGANSELHERRELSGYVVTWNALHPGRAATLDS